MDNNKWLILIFNLNSPSNEDVGRMIISFLRNCFILQISAQIFGFHVSVLRHQIYGFQHQYRKKSFLIFSNLVLCKMYVSWKLFHFRNLVKLFQVFRSFEHIFAYFFANLHNFNFNTYFNGLNRLLQTVKLPRSKY